MLCLLGTFKGSHWSKPFQCTGKDESIAGNEIGFSKIASMHCTDCNSIINRFHHKFFLKNVLKKKTCSGFHQRTFGSWKILEIFLPNIFAILFLK